MGAMSESGVKRFDGGGIVAEYHEMTTSGVERLRSWILCFFIEVDDALHRD